MTRCELERRQSRWMGNCHCCFYSGFTSNSFQLMQPINWGGNYRLVSRWSAKRYAQAFVAIKISLNMYGHDTARSRSWLVFQLV